MKTETTENAQNKGNGWTNFKTRTAQARAQKAFRDNLIAELGMEPEGAYPYDNYVGSTFEFLRDVNEKRAAAGTAPVEAHCFLCQTMNPDGTPRR